MTSVGPASICHYTQGEVTIYDLQLLDWLEAKSARARKRKLTFLPGNNHLGGKPFATIPMSVNRFDALMKEYFRQGNQ